MPAASSVKIWYMSAGPQCVATSLEMSCKAGYLHALYTASWSWGARIAVCKYWCVIQEVELEPTLHQQCPSVCSADPT